MQTQCHNVSIFIVSDLLPRPSSTLLHLDGLASLWHALPTSSYHQPPRQQTDRTTVNTDHNNNINKKESEKFDPTSSPNRINQRKNGKPASSALHFNHRGHCPEPTGGAMVCDGGRGVAYRQVRCFPFLTAHCFHAYPDLFVFFSVCVCVCVSPLPL